MRIDELHNIFLSSNGVSTDSRTISEGYLFFGLKGPTFDGNLKAEEALLSGASYSIVDDVSVVRSDRFILVDNVLQALQDLARYHRDTIDVPVLAITGSNGKTTTKELLREVLETKYKVACTVGNFNNHIGVPLTLLNQPRDAEVWIIEMGTNAPGNIQELCDIGKPNLGLITNIGSAHLEQLINQEGVFYEKTALFNSVLESGGVIFINEEDKWLKQYPKTTKAIFYSSTKNEELSLTLTESLDNFLHVKVKSNKGIFNIDSSLTGRYNLQNISAAMVIGQYFDIALQDICNAISSYVPSNMRSQVKRSKSNILVIDAYNANPTSMTESILSHISKPKGNLVFILGDMLELGSDALSYHESILDLVCDSQFQVITVGPLFYSCNNKATYRFEKVEDLIASDILPKIQDREILIKGSRGMKLEKVIPFL